jgi:hypothetical protein
VFRVNLERWRAARPRTGGWISLAGLFPYLNTDAQIRVVTAFLAS